MAERVRRRATTGKIVFVGRVVGYDYVTYAYVIRRVTPTQPSLNTSITVRDTRKGWY